MDTRVQTGALLPAAWIAHVNQWSVPFFNVPMTVVATAAMGSLLSYAWGDRVEHKKSLYLTALSSTFLGVVSVAVLPVMMGWQWAEGPLQAPLAGLIALSMRFVFPHATVLIPEILRKIFRLDNGGTFTGRQEDATEQTKEENKAPRSGR